MWQKVRRRLRDHVARFVVPGRTYANLAGRHEELQRRHDQIAHVHLDLTQKFDDLSRQHHQAVMEKNHIRHMYETWRPTGHYYSPYPDLDEFDARAAKLFDTNVRPAGIALRDAAQVELFGTLAGMAEEAPFPADQSDEFRYFYDNGSYGWGDGVILHAMLRHIRPRRLVEIGSGNSSAMMLDTVDGWLDGDVEVSFVEPYPDLLHSLLRPGDEGRLTIYPQPAQDVPLEVFTSLEAGDVLFIDSTHVVKAGSDVNHLYFEVLPQLAPGVWVHIHDVFFPFEYPVEWVHEGRAWQEVYLLRAFLMFNPTFEIRWFQRYMWARHRQMVEDRLPQMAKDPGGNIWLQRTVLA